MAYFSRLILLFVCCILPLSNASSQTVTERRAVVSIGGISVFKTFVTSWRVSTQVTDSQLVAELVSIVDGQPLELAPGYESNYSSCVALGNETGFGYRCYLKSGGNEGRSIQHYFETRVVPDNPPCPASGTTEGDSSNAYTTSSKVPSNNLCIGSCSWSAGGVVPSVCANGKCYYYGPFTSNGTACTGEGGAPAPKEPDPAPPDDAKCVSKGQCPGTINGTKVCVPCSSKEGTTSESGSSSSEGTDSSGAPTGSTGTTNTTKETTANCTNGSCNTTTTTTVTNPDGSTTTTTETESTPQPDFCKANPGHIVCKGEDEGTFGGSCAAGFQCSGDAVQCAQAEAGWKSACASDVSGMTDQINDGTAAMASGAASGLGIPGGSDAFDLGSRLSDVPLFGSSGGCPSDVSVNVGGTSYTIAFSAMCPQLQVLGVALMAFAYLVAGFIVFRGDRS